MNDRIKRSPAFPATPWSLIREAALTGSAQSAEALARLCESYWYPLYAFVRRSGHGADEAQDLVQGFFARFLEKNYFKGLDARDGRFRSYLLGAIRHFLSNERERANAKKRSAPTLPLELDLEAGERRFRAEPETEVTPEHDYERKWALALLRAVMTRLETDYRDAGKSEVFDVMRAFLPGARQSLTYEEAAERTGVSADTLKVRTHRLRKRYRDLLRQEVARTVESNDELDAELRFLAKVLAR